MLDIEKVRRLRERAGLSQADAATKAGIGSRQRWHDIESGTKANIALDTLDKIAKALGVKARDLLK